MNGIDKQKPQEQEKEKLDKGLLIKVMAMAIDSANKEKMFEIDDFRIRVKLSDNNFVVRVGIAPAVDSFGGVFNIVKYVRLLNILGHKNN